MSDIVGNMTDYSNGDKVINIRSIDDFEEVFYIDEEKKRLEAIQKLRKFRAKQRMELGNIPKQNKTVGSQTEFSYTRLVQGCCPYVSTYINNTYTRNVKPYIESVCEEVRKIQRENQ